MAEPQPPEGLRKLFIEVAHGQNCIACVIGRGRCGGLDEVDEDVADAFLAALFEACEVREEWGAELLTPGYPSGAVWYPSREGAEKVRARHEPLPPATMGGLLRRLVLAMPGEPVSSTGEETPGG